MSKLYLISILALVVSICSLQSCYYDIESELYGDQFCDTLSIPSYSQKVAPIMDQFCTSCHGGDTPQEDISLETYEEVSLYVANGKLSCSINHGSGCSPMPDSSPKIPECDILEIERWISAGAAND